MTPGESVVGTGRIERGVRIALSVVLLLPQAVAPATIRVGRGCTLTDAISAANRDAPVGGCPAGSGADTLRLSTDVELTRADNPNNGLPRIDSQIEIDGKGFSIERAETAPPFRILDVLESGSLALDEVIIANGRVSGRGGGIRTLGTLALQNSTVTGNESLKRGGGIYAKGVYDRVTRVSLVNSTVSHNAARRGAGIAAYENVALSISGGSISGNVASSRGGGILLSNSYAAISNSTIASNSAPSGGGIRAAFYSGLDIDGTTISKNTSTRFEGGGIFSSYSYVSMFRSRVTGNSATRGGGLFIDTGYGESYLLYSTISGNSASESGGGLFFAGDRGNLRLSSSTISGNLAETGGGIYLFSTNYRAASRISYTTISQNTASRGAGIHAMNAYSDLHVLTNSVVAGNDGGNCSGPGLDQSDVFSNFDNDGSCPGSRGIVPGADFDEELSDNGGPTRTHALFAGSPAIDAFGSCRAGSDQRLFRRDESCDFGSYEFGADEVGASVTGISGRRVLCKNTTTGEKQEGTNGQTSWLCQNLGVSTLEGDRVRLSSLGKADGTAPVGGSVSGLEPSPKPRVLCRNRTTRKKVSFALSSRSWDCEAQGLLVNPGDSVLQKVRGTARDLVG